MENWYRKLHSLHPVLRWTDSKSRISYDSHIFKTGLIFDWVNGMRLAIPVFHTKFDPLQLLFNGFGKNSPYGDFGDFLAAILAISRQDAIRWFQNWALLIVTHLSCQNPLKHP